MIPRPPISTRTDTLFPYTPLVRSPACKECAARAGAILHGKFGYYFKCDACGKNTAIRFTCQPGHQPRLRKDRDRFYRECEDCGSSELFHRNTSTGAASCSCRFPSSCTNSSSCWPCNSPTVSATQPPTSPTTCASVRKGE